MKERTGSADAVPANVAGYRILSPIGRGGMGTVYRAINRDGQKVALKLLAPHLVDNDVQRSRFQQEARVAMTLDHPNIIRALDVGEDNGRHYIAMELVDGENLGAMIKRRGSLPEEEATAIACAIAQALHAAHVHGLIHRDVKPDNVLIGRDGAAKLADMGLVKSLGEDLNLTKTGRGLGTPHFMAPEQFRNAKNVNFRSDIYALGATLYAMVTGEIPFKGNTALDTFLKKGRNEFASPRSIMPTVSEALEKVILAAMDADPEKRPPSAKAFAEWVRQTRPSSPEPHDSKAQDDRLWYVLYPGDDGQEKKLKGTDSALRHQIKKGRLDVRARAARSKQGPFLPLSAIEEFRDLLGINERQIEPTDVHRATRDHEGPTVETIGSGDDWWSRRWSEPRTRWIALGASAIVLVLGIALWMGWPR